MLLNKTFYPTPKPMIRKMADKIQNKNINSFLDPSAGKGDILNYIENKYGYNHGKLYAIEIDETLQATLRGSYYEIIDSDFLTFAGADKFDVIIANPPFDEGEKHLLKAIDIMYNGEIIFLLNAETIKNPYTNTRKLLCRKLEELGANIEYIKDAFMIAERKTAVEVALIYIKIENCVESDLFDGIENAKDEESENIEDAKEIQTLNSIKNMVDEYSRVVNIGTQTLIDYYKNYNVIGNFIHLKNDGDKNSLNGTGEDLTRLMTSKLNSFLIDVREHFWKSVLTLDAVTSRLTSAKSDEFYHRLKNQAFMDFTENNIRQFIINLINGYEQTLTEAVVKLFDEMTRKYAWDGRNEFEKNLHYFNGWKTNKAFYVNKKVIMPWYNFIGWSGQWQVEYDDKRKLHDIDLVMTYFSATQGFYNSISNSLELAFGREQTRKVYSTYFEISVFKKGTIHLTFRDEDILRRFNIVACKGKGWLPQDYGYKPFEQLTDEKQAIVESFEGEESYEKNLMDCSFQITAPKNLLIEG